MELSTLFKNIADAIRTKTGKTDKIVAENFATEISGITTDQTGNATALATDILSGKTAYARGEELTGTMPEVALSKPAFTFDRNNGKITAECSVTEGHIEAQTISNVLNIGTAQGSMITPTTTNQTVVTPGHYMLGSIIVKGDANLQPYNIASGRSIFGVNGTFVDGPTDYESYTVSTSAGVANIGVDETFDYKAFILVGSPGIGSVLGTAIKIDGDWYSTYTTQSDETVFTTNRFILNGERVTWTFSETGSYSNIRAIGIY